jgi:predicted nucleic acid-binding protein
MPVNYQIHAEVVDIRSDAPLPDDRFLVDTNVWFWMAYSRASLTAKPYQMRQYPTYIRQVVGARGHLYRCNLSFAEMTHSIEQAELTIFNKARASGTPVGTKEYRHNHPAERLNIVNEIQSAWGLVKTMAQPLDMTINEPIADAAVSRLPTVSVDGYDLFILEAMSKHGITDVITDDGDFATIPGIRVFTANATALSLASARGLLIVR